MSSSNNTLTQSTEWLFSPLFKHHLGASPPEFLYHYTNGDGLLGILQTSTLWATTIEYLNDSPEFRGASDMLKDRLKEEFYFNDTLADINTLSRRKQISLWLSQVLEQKHSGGHHVICFCANGDILSQWRGYSDGSYGYSVGFRTETLTTFSKNAGFVLGKCIYQKDVQKAIIEELFNYCLAMSSSRDEILSEIASALIQCGAFFKDDSFAEENEWRLVSLGRDIWTMRFRRGKSMITPYIVLPIGAEANSSIDHVYIGPCPHMTLSEKSMWMLLGQKGITGDVRCSRIPFRDW
jgi:hypothetical protein